MKKKLPSLFLCSPSHPPVDTVKIPIVLAHKWNVINCTDVQCTTDNFSHFCASENTPSTDTMGVTIILNIFLCPFLCVCLCLHGRVYSRVCGCMCIRLEVRGWCWVPFFSCSSFCFWDRVSDRTRTSLVCLDWLTSKPQCWLGCKQPLSVQAGDPNLGSHACLLDSPALCPL